MLARLRDPTDPVWHSAGCLGRRLLAAALWWTLWGLLGGAASAQSALPAPQVAGDMHVGPLSQIRGTPDGRLVLTIGADKTLRLWRTADLAPVRTIHLPSDAGNEGDPRSLAISPDGRLVYVGGWTGTDWHGGLSQVYVFDIATGAMRQVWRGQPGVIASMALSRDGRQLALGLSQSLRVLDTRDGRLIFEDTQYGGPVGFADYAPDGGLATVADDGCVRLYDPERKLRFRAAYPQPPPGASACPGGRLGGIRFSPDGQRLAFGLVERPEVVVMDVAGLRVLRALAVAEPGQKGLCCISWSKGGEILTVYGEHERTEQTPLYRVDQGGLGVARRFDIGRHAFTNSLPLADGGLIVATDTPRLLRVNAAGRTLAAVEPPNGDFRGIGERLRLSADARQVAFTLGAGEPVLAFTLDAAPSPGLRALPGEAPASLRPPHRAGPLTVAAELGRFSYLKPMRVGSAEAPMSPGESLYSWAGQAAQGVALGTAWAVKLVDARGQLRWTTPITSPAYGVNLSQDGRWVVAALGDGSLRWLDAATGHEALGLYVHLATREWVAWRPDGYYTSSTRGDQYFGWRVNRGEDREPDFFRAVQFERQLYRPDLLAASLQTERAALAGAGAQSLARVLQAAGVPRVRIESVQPTARGTLEVAVSVEAGSRAVSELGVFVDGLPAMAAADRVVALGQGQTMRRVFDVPLLSPGARVRVEAETGGSIGADETLPLQAPPPAQRANGRLHVLAVGITAFPGGRGNISTLRGAAPDAQLMADTLRELGERRYDSVNVTLVNDRTNDPGSRHVIVDRLRRLQQQVAPEDTVVVFFASHGLTDAGEFYVVTRDTVIEDTNRVLLAKDAGKRLAAGEAPSLISGSELTDLLRRLPGRRILILDTCHAGAAGNGTDPQVLFKRGASAQVAVMSAASGDEESMESDKVRHGVFTYALSQALRGELEGAAKAVTLGEVFRVVAPRVTAEVRARRDAERDPALKPRYRQTPVLTAIPALEATVLVAR